MLDWDAPLSGADSFSGRLGAGAWDNYAPPPSGRSADPLSPWFSDPRIDRIADRHPTLMQCAQRDVQIAAWERQMEWWESSKRFRLALHGSALPLFVAAVALLVLGQTVLAAAVALAIPVVLVWSAKYRGQPDPGLPPQRIVFKPYDDFENRTLMVLETPTPFRSVCGCPGCGDVDTHQIVRQTKAAMVVRRCVTCCREWCQR